MMGPVVRGDTEQRQITGALDQLPYTPYERAPGTAPAEAVEALLKRSLEEVNFSFAKEDLANLKGFLVCEDGYRRIVWAGGLEKRPEERILLYLRMVGHVVLGHVDERKPSIRYDFWEEQGLPPELREENHQADRWAVYLMEKCVKPAGKKEVNLLLAEVFGAIERNLGVSDNLVLRLMHRISSVLYDRVELYRKLRCRPGIQDRLAALRQLLR